ncbi:MAG TPA: O-antigen ligase [Pseudacidobacterium sp.]|nr:O-antigen ligase [Pseudacidobacterium sp.]
MSRVGVAELICAGILAFFAMQGAIPGIAPNQANEMTNTAATGLMKVAGIGSQILVDGTILVLVLHQWRRFYRLAFTLQWTAAISALALLSILWSQDAVMTARRAVPFALATLFGLYFAARYPVRKQLSIFCATMLFAALGSAVLAIFFPAIGLEASTGHFGNWQGVFTQKNACGRAMVFATAAVLACGRLNLYRLVCLLAFLFVLIMSGTRGAWVIEGALLLCYMLTRIIGQSTPSFRAVLIYLVVALAVMAVVAIWMYFPLLAALLGRDATLTGRTAIWQQVWQAIVKHPLLGYGYAAFWRGMKGESYNVILALKFVIFHAHNGFLEIWLELGAAGVLLFVLSYARAWRKLWPLLLHRRMADCSWMIFVLVLVVLYDLDENTLLTFNGLFWVVYVAVVANIEILSVEHKAQHLLRMAPGNEMEQISRRRQASALAASRGI